jgi:hypothetical protein
MKRLFLVGLVAAAAATALGGCNLVSRSCTDDFRSFSIVVSRELPVDPALAATLTVEGCLDGVCVSGRPLPDAAVPSVEPFYRLGSFPAPMGRSDVANVWLKKGERGGLLLDVGFGVGERTPGTRMEIRVRVLNGTTEILTTSGTVEWEDTGSGCDRATPNPDRI